MTSNIPAMFSHINLAAFFVAKPIFIGTFKRNKRSVIYPTKTCLVYLLAQLPLFQHFIWTV